MLSNYFGCGVFHVLFLPSFLTNFKCSEYPYLLWCFRLIEMCWGFMWTFIWFDPKKYHVQLIINRQIIIHWVSCFTFLFYFPLNRFTEALSHYFERFTEDSIEWSDFALLEHLNVWIPSMNLTRVGWSLYPIESWYQFFLELHSSDAPFCVIWPLDSRILLWFGLYVYGASGVIVDMVKLLLSSPRSCAWYCELLMQKWVDIILIFGEIGLI